MSSSNNKNNLNNNLNNNTNNKVIKNNNKNTAKNTGKNTGKNSNKNDEGKKPFSKTVSNFFFGSDIAFVSTLVFGLIFGAVLLMTALDQRVPPFRRQLVSNSMGIILSLAFIYIIFKFMGQSVTILGKTFDFGMIIYILIIVLCVVIFSG
mgnify:CR=1 FL=1|tara:strand:+ start:2215 stop:2664 length:450 start_codon:yes stop_codon:yes gene_type:complete